MPSHKLFSAAKKCPRCGNLKPRYEPVPESPGIVWCSQVSPWQAHRYLLEHAFGILDPLLWVLDQLGLRRLPQR